ncbi:MAG: hypothetical protein FWE36_02850 [Erysipelotrichales bacterium]|nr:hypothetical protein [Erysipelotrichales bacterium]
MPCEKCGTKFKKSSSSCPNCQTSVRKKTNEPLLSRGKALQEGELYARSSIIYGVMSIFFVVVGVIIGIVSIYFGIKGFKRLKSIDKPIKYAVFGIILGSIGFILWIYLIIFSLPSVIESIRNPAS